MTETSIQQPHTDRSTAYLSINGQNERVIFEPGNVTPQPETPEFAAELEHPATFNARGMSLGLFRLNRRYEAEGAVPVALMLPLGEEAGSGPGRADLNAFAHTVERPLLVIDMPGRGASAGTPIRKLAKASLEDLALAYLDAYNQAGTKQFDVISTSMGSFLAVKVAELVGSRVQHLITFSAPSFDKRSTRKLIRSREVNRADFRRARALAAPAVRQELEAFKRERQAIHDALPFTVKAKNFSVLLKQAGIVRGNKMSGMSGRLSPSTTWLDVVGSEDAFTDWRAHQYEVRARNKQHPGTADITVLDKETHAWLAVHRWDMAALAAARLR